MHITRTNVFFLCVCVFSFKWILSTKSSFECTTVPCVVYYSLLCSKNMKKKKTQFYQKNSLHLIIKAVRCHHRCPSLIFPTDVDPTWLVFYFDHLKIFIFRQYFVLFFFPFDPDDKEHIFNILFTTFDRGYLLLFVISADIDLVFTP